MNPFQSNSGLILSEEKVKLMIRDIIVPLLINKDLNISDASILASLDSIKDIISDVVEKSKIEKSFEWHSPFYIRVPKACDKPITVEIDGLDAANRSVSIGFRIPISFFNNDNNEPHIIYANKYAIKIVKEIKYDKNTADSTNNNIFIIESADISNGKIVTHCLDPEVREYKATDDTPAISFSAASKVLKLAPDTGIEEIPEADKLLRTHSDVDYIDFITTAMLIKLDISNQMDERTAYFTRDDNNTDNLTFKFRSLEEAKSKIPILYNKLADLWRFVSIEFEPSVTDISGLFENMDHSDTVKSIIGFSITKADNLYRHSKISYISPDLLSSLNRLGTIDEGFANCKNLVEVPKAELLFNKNTSLKSAKGLFEDSGLKKDPEYWMYTNADLTGYIRKSLEDPIGPVPYQGYALNRVYPANFDVNNWVFKDVEAFKTYYKDRMVAYKSVDPIDKNDLSKFSITIKEGNLDEMFYGTTIVKLPKTVIGEKAMSANSFAADVTTVQYTDSLTNIFTRCPKLASVRNCFSGCTGLTKGFELLGASDTIRDYSGVFENCTNIDWQTLPYPWRWNGLDGYPDNIIGINGFKNIPNLPNWVPKEWGGPGTEADPNAHPGSRTPVPVVTSCYVGDDYFTLSFTNMVQGDLVEIAMVDADHRFNILGDVKRIYATMTSSMVFGIGDITADKHDKLTDKDCIRVRFREMKRTPNKLWSEYIYQVPQLRLVPLNPTDSASKVLGFITDGEV